jgi:hypothetical protein
MVLEFYGGGFTRLSLGDFSVILNPLPKSRLGASVILSGYPHDPWSDKSTETSSHGALLFDGPGEYETKGVFFEGFPSLGPAGKLNTIYTFSLEGLKIVYLGALAETELPADVKEELGSADLTLVPVGGDGTVSPRDSLKLVRQLESNVVVPIGWTDLKDNHLKSFIDESGSKGDPIPKLVLKKKDSLSKSGEVALVKSF